jgi:endogenous inhibitor of DNA gyrase (YacG/DUF329 family)
MDNTAWGLDCPHCSARVPWRNIIFGVSFPCPNCGSVLSIPKSHIRRMTALSVTLTAVIAYLLGARWTLPIAVVLGLFPVSMLVSAIGRIVAPPRLEISEE